MSRCSNRWKDRAREEGGGLDVTCFSSKTIFEDVLGFKQDDLSGVKIGFNGVRTITFKLKQQFDVDELFEWEYFEI